MTQVIAIIHSTHCVIEALMKEVSTCLPEVEVINMLDESLLAKYRSAQGLDPAVRRKVYSMVQSATESAAELVLFSCSSISPLVAQLQPFFSVPILSVDGLFFQEVVKEGTRLVVFGTGSSALTAARHGLEEAGRLKRKDIQVETVLCGVGAGHTSPAEYHRYLAAEIESNLAQRTFDGALLAQLSMVPALAHLPEQVRVKIQHAMPFAITSVRETLGR